MEKVDTAGPSLEPSLEPVLTLRGSPLFPEVAGGLPPSSLDAMDQAVAVVRKQAAEWAAVPVSGRVVLLDQMIADVRQVADSWVCSCMDAKGFEPGPSTGEEWLTGPQPLLRNLRLLRDALAD